ncbi:type I polyketide synthase [Kitasatospora sp. NPDC092039]|uniref:type I polyketide synthase n=1 Tax=Kitasatospora sp. NPDC092039 TaxID=3364086 RepID=UPI003802413F
MLFFTASRVSLQAALKAGYSVATTSRPDFSASIVNDVRARAAELPEKPAIIMLAEGESELERLSFAEYDRRARAFAAGLQARGMAGERVLILLPQGVDYAVAFLGCLYAQAIAVPAFPPTRSRKGARVEGIVDDCTPRLAVVGTDRVEAMGRELPGDCAVMTTGELTSADPDDWREPEFRPDDVGYLQYTSGSTGRPRGVMVTHRNIVQQLDMLADGLELEPDEVSLSWLPLFHDFGLVAGLLFPLRAGVTNVLMAPIDFVQEPLRWLAAATRYRAALTFGPNFALDLCCERIRPEDRAGLDLSALRTLMIGAEPIRPQSIERFAAEFAPVRCRADIFTPAYGMAESTLAVTMRRRNEPLALASFDVEELGRGRLRSVPDGAPGSRLLPSNGDVLPGTGLLVVDPETRTPVPDGECGELWLSGDTVSPGYWRNAEATEAAFGARLADGSGPYLRTGDLGGRVGPHTYITGRRKDLIVVRGVNHYPHDIELTVADSHPAVERDKGVAFPVEDAEGVEQLVVVSELTRDGFRGADREEVVRSIRLAVVEEHGLDPQTVVLIRPAQLPLTSSGKVRRQECRRLFLEDGLKPVHVSSAAAVRETPAGAGPERSRKAVAEWLTERIAGLRRVTPREVPQDAPFGSFGLDSAGLAGLAGDLRAWLGAPVDTKDLYNHPTIAALATALAGGDDARPDRAAQLPQAEPAEAADSREPIAVVGMACRLPGAEDVEAFWRLLVDGRDAVTEVPPRRRLLGYRLEHGEPAWGGFVDGVEEFDAAFFGVSRDEARRMDPQQRLLLTTVWRALEDAGTAPETLAGGRTGVFVGISTNDYGRLQDRAGGAVTAHDGTGNASSIAANRISYLWDLRGPSQAVDTACSSSLVALHQACTSLRLGECDLAVVAGVNLLLDPGLTTVFTEAGMLAPDGRCKTFDAAADGYVRGEGCGVVVLRRQSDAIAADDRIRALVQGSAVTSDGRSSTLTAPNGPSQEAVLRAALASAGLGAEQVGYVEAHGTGTRLGDPIEMGALRAVYGESAGAELHVGSVKSNIGHLEAAAGMAGLIKAVLCLEHRRIPASLHVDTVNPLIGLDGSRLRIPRSTTEWPAGPGRAAAVSSFGFGGTNAHVILSGAPARRPRVEAAESGEWSFLPVSAKTGPALRRLAADYAEAVAQEGGTAPVWSALVHTAGARRSHHDHRIAVLARSNQEAAEALAAYLDGGPAPAVVQGVAHGGGSGPVAFVFTGQGAQYPGMAKALYFRHAAFRTALDEVDALVRAELGASLLPTLCDAPGPRLDLEQTRFAQPALFAVDYALAELWRACGVRPDAVAGHSLGEYAAACVAGVLSLPDAVRLVVARAALMQDLAGAGAMYAVHAGRELIAEVRADLPADRSVVVAAVNGPEDVVISGTEQSAAELAARWERRGAKVTRLHGTRAFHSPLMAGAVAEFERVAATVDFRPPAIPVVANLTGAVQREFSAAYFARHALEPVRFGDCLETLAALGCATVVECGPHPVLGPLVEAVLTDAVGLPTLHRDDTDDRRFQRGLAEWYVRGGRVDWAGVRRDRDGEYGRPPLPVALPGHPLAPTRYWFTDGGDGRHPLLGAPVELAGAGSHWFSRTLTAGRPWYLDEHRVAGRAVLPAAAMAEWADAAVRAVAGDGPWTFEGVSFTAFLALPEDAPVTAQAVVETVPDGYRVRGFGRVPGAGAWTGHVTVEAARPAGPDPDARADLDLLRVGLAERDVDALYGTLRARELEYGPAFRALRALWAGEKEAVGLVEADLPAEDRAAYRAHPVVLDACFHVAAAFLGDGSGDGGDLLLPVGVDRITVHRPLPARVWCVARDAGTAADGERSFDLDLVSEDGGRLATVEALRLRPVAPERIAAAAGAAAGSAVRGYRTDWVPAPEAGTADRPGSWLVCGTDASLVDGWCAEAAVPALGLLVAPDASDEALARLFAEARGRVDGVAGLVLQAGGEDAAALAGTAFAALRGFLREFGADRPEIVVCSTGAVRVPQAPTRPDAAQAPLTGLAKAVIAEYPDLKCVQVDFEPRRTPPTLAGLLARVAGLPGRGHLAVRDGRWFAARLRETGLGGTPAAPVRADASYLVTGGLGALGLATAGRLAGLGARCLVLTGRSLPAGPPREVEELRAAGVRVELWPADVADLSAATALVERIGRELPPLRGVVHAAGTTDDAPLVDLDRGRFAAVLRPKVQGAQHLHALTADAGLDFLVFYSSLASLTGSAGQANYAAANAFLDGLAEQRRHDGQPALSVNWGPWAEAGLAARPELLARLARTGITGLGTEEALTALGSVLGGGLPVVGLAAVDWARYTAADDRRTPYTLLGGLAPERAAAPAPDERLPEAPAEPAAGRTADQVVELALRDPRAGREALTEDLLAAAGELLGLTAGQREELRPTFGNRRLNELGLDSLTAVRLRNRLLADFSADVPPSFVFGGNTVADVVDLILRQITLRSLVAADEGEDDEAGDVEVLTF